MSTLYELTDAYKKFLELESELDGEVFADTLESIDEAIEDKAENLAKVIKQLEATATMFDNEAKRLQNKKQTAANRATNLKSYLKGEMEKVGKLKIKGDLFSLNIQNNPPSVALEPTFDNNDYIADVVVKYDKRAILNDLKQGKEIEGATITQGNSLRIR